VKRSRAFLYVLAVLLLGILIGGFGVHLYYAKKFPPGRSKSGRRGPFNLARLEEALKLTPEQRQRIEEILRESRREADQMREEFSPRVREHLERKRQSIMEVLTPEQRQKFDEIWSRHRSHAERFFLKRRPSDSRSPPSGP
jgi:Spy/CpxP family protein refolding chaperone